MFPPPQPPIGARLVRSLANHNDVQHPSSELGRHASEKPFNPGTSALLRVERLVWLKAGLKRSARMSVSCFHDRNDSA